MNTKVVLHEVSLFFMKLVHGNGTVSLFTKSLRELAVAHDHLKNCKPLRLSVFETCHVKRGLRQHYHT